MEIIINGADTVILINDFGVDCITDDYGVSIELSGDNYESQTFFIKGE